LTAVFSYPLYFTLLGVFAYKSSMRNIESMLTQYQQLFHDVSVLGTLFSLITLCLSSSEGIVDIISSSGTFIDNHDHPRFLNVQPDYTLYKNALTYVLTAIGIQNNCLN
jgi:hypothetical protein